MVIELDRTAATPLYLQISEQLQEQIRNGELAAGDRLPPERRLAAMLGVNRTTVVNAYRELAADGYVAGHVGRGTVVVGAGSMAAPKQPLSGEMPWEQLFTSTTEVMNTPLLRDTRIVSARHDVISLRDRHPIARALSHRNHPRVAQQRPARGWPIAAAILPDRRLPAVARGTGRLDAA